MIMTQVGNNVVMIFLGLALKFGSICALPQQASVSLFEFLPAGESTTVVGTEWAQPIGTASDGSETTFILENVVTASGLVSTSGATLLTTVTATGIETVVVSASGWVQSNFPTTTAAGSTRLGGGLDCHFTASASGECVEEQVDDDGSTTTRTLSGDVITQIFPISTGTLPSGAGVAASSSGNSQSTITAVSTTSSSGQTTTSTSSSSTSASSNASLSAHKGLGVGLLTVVVSGMIFGASSVAFL
ncbi:hypothetical protein F5051DRAFT_160105 [Lentinula edodes]|nr:hypothetical protein F5051DRAFT_160105 [Lentinula edodes]